MKEQLNLFHFEKDMDPIYQGIKRLRKGETFFGEYFMVTLNDFGIYEIQGEDFHEGKQKFEECYERVIELEENMKQERGRRG